MLQWLRRSRQLDPPSDKIKYEYDDESSVEVPKDVLLTSNVNKRDLNENEDDDSLPEVITVAPRVKKVTPPNDDYDRGVKRRRILDRVEIPAPTSQDWFFNYPGLSIPADSENGMMLFSPAQPRANPLGVSASGRPKRAASKPLVIEPLVDNEDYDFPMHVLSPTASSSEGEDVEAPESTEDSGSEFGFQDEETVSEDDDIDEVGEESEESSIMASEPESEVNFDGRKKAKLTPSSKTSQPSKTFITKSATGPSSTSKHVPGKKQMLSLLQRAQDKGLDGNLPPLFQIEDIFNDITKKGLDLGLKKALDHFNGRPLRVATMCSGTESPLLALKMIQDILPRYGANLKVEHLFSAEIVPYKQAYIERNFAPKIIFRDITELVDAVKEDVPKATTAYGAKVEVPTDVDIVIAGTSCVDFSRLNNNKKGLDGDGESAKTWEAVTAFNKAFRPAIVILENVLGADWDAMLDCYRDINYESAGVLVDTKHFYIPHTRQRGYMTCFDKSRGADTSFMGKRWQELVDKFRRPASSPVTSFLEPNDRIHVSQARLAQVDEPGREVDWTQCEITQMQYRQDKRLGTMRPFTQWQESGAMVPPENGVRAWYSNQVERVLDSIDCSILRKSLDVHDPRSKKLVTEGYDARYKTRIWDLSQNVYRFTDASAFGITGCITPSGMFFASDAGRSMTSIESLKLQGLPIERITLTTETPTELQDLAGNAMSSTVVGSAILSALIAGYSTIIPGHSDEDVPENLPITDKICAPMANEKLTESKMYHYTLDQASLPILLVKARQAMRRCYCEGTSGICEKPLQQCLECGHIACASCAGNPVHAFKPDETIQNGRLTPSDFIDYVKSVLPLSVKFSGLQDGIQALTSKLGNTSKYVQLVQAASQDTYTFVRVRRTASWTVEYQSPNGRLELRISDLGAEWHLFANPESDLPTKDPLRKILSSAIVKSTAAQNLLGDSWQWRLTSSVKQKQEKVMVTGTGLKVPSWWARNGLPDYQDRLVWSQLEIKLGSSDVLDHSAISGTYVHLPKCGTACDSLYKRVEDLNGDRKAPVVYLFLDPDRVGSPNEDQFVFSRQKSILEYGESRSVIARLDPTWRPWKSGEVFTRPSLSTDGIWCNIPTTSLVVEEREVSLDLPTVSNRFDNTPCRHATQLITCSFTDGDSDDTVGQNVTQVEERDAHFYNQHSWALEVMRQHVPESTWQSLDIERVCRCEQCAPPMPVVQWRLSSDGQSVQPCEDPSSAANYEQRIKKRPSALVLQTHARLGRRFITLGVNITTLAHRALNRLARQTAADMTKSKITWKFECKSLSSTFSFQPFKLKSTRGSGAFEDDTGLKIELFPQQKEALQWMRLQETGITFPIEEIEEAVLPQLNWRLEVRAQADFTVRGGICADHPGFGKTITSLALIGSEQQNSDSMAELELRKEKFAPGLVPIKATLIVCPGTLIKQWQAEIQEKLGWIKGREVLVLNTLSDMDKCKLSDYRNARIVLANRSIIANPNYTDRVAAFAAIPGPAVTTGRGHSKWMEYATQQFPSHLAILQEKGLSALKQKVKSSYEEHLKDGSFNTLIPSKRLKGKAYAAAQKTKKGTAGSHTTAASSINTDRLNTPLLEMFYFNRLIADEFHDSDAKEYAALKNIKSDKRWGLSATPALNDMYEVSQIAELLNIPLRYGSHARGVMKTKNARKLRKELTSFEQFDAMRQQTSDALHRRMYEIDMAFLDTFVRQNIMDLDVMQYEDHLVPVTLDLAHMALYTELSQHLNSQDMKIKKGKRSKTSDRDKEVTDATQGAESAEEALSKRAAFWGREEATLKDLIRRREQEAESNSTKLQKALEEAAKTKNRALFTQWRGTQLQAEALGDQSVVTEIYEMLKPYDKKNSATEGKHAEANSEERSKLARCNTLAKVLTVSRRSTRYLHNLQRMQDASLSCDHPQCQGKEGVRKAVSAFCGHVVCEPCYQDLREKSMSCCPADGCHSGMHDYHLLWSNKVSSLVSQQLEFGAKIEAAMGLLSTIKKQGDQAILFVQHEDQLEHIAHALSARKIEGIVVRDKKDAGQLISDFQQGSDATVIVLNASSETAAGSNLQRANHVIFLSPLLRDTQYAYDSTMAQAIGRVRRHGQKKEIHVYRILALDTIDVDILEHRERRSNALTEQHHAEPIAPPSASLPSSTEDYFAKERTQLVRINNIFSLQPRSWLVRDTTGDSEPSKIMAKSRVGGWEDFSSLVKFSRVFTEDDV